jgi:hypothetical protein
MWTLYAAQASSAIVNSPIAVSNTLWPQRAISSSMFDLQKMRQMIEPGAWMRLRCTSMGTKLCITTVTPYGDRR